MAKSILGVPTLKFVLALVAVGIIASGVTFLAVPQISQISGAGGQVVKVGHLLPATGPLGQYADGFENGVNAAVQEANALGGIGGRTIQLIEEDTATDPSTAAAGARKLIEVDNVKAIVGGYASSSTLAGAPIAEENGVIMIAPASTSPLVTDAGDYIFRTAPSDSLQGRAMAELALKLGFTKAATIHINNQYGVGLADVFTEVFEQGGGSVVLSVPYELERATYRTELSQIKSANPDIIVDVSYADDGQIIFREAAELGISSQLLGSDGIADPAIFDAPGVAEAIDGMVGTRPSAPETSATKHFNSLLSEYGLASGIYSAEAYDAAKMSILAISMAGPDASGSEIRDALVYVSQSYVGASGEKAYDQNGDVGGQFSIWKVIDGEFVTIGSWNIAAGVEIVGN